MNSLLRDASILVTGGTGFVGAHLTRRLAAVGARTHLLIRPTSSLRLLADVEPAPDHTRLDMADTGALEACIRRVRPDVVFHLAAASSEREKAGPRVEPDPNRATRVYEVNVLGTLRLLQAIAGAAPSARVVRAGTLSEYGLAPLPFREDQRERPVSHYAASHMAATHLGQAVFRQRGVAVTTVRLALTYGPAQSNRFFIPSLIQACLEDRPFDMTSGTQRRDLLFVDDAIDALLAAAATPGLAGEVLNAGSGGDWSVRELGQLIVRLTGAGTELRVGTLPGRRIDLVCDSTRLQQACGWTARTPIEEGLSRTIAWYREARKRDVSDSVTG
jgi:UDP-glucose 4-epimerase